MRYFNFIFFRTQYIGYLQANFIRRIYVTSKERIFADAPSQIEVTGKTIYHQEYNLHKVHI